MKPKFQFILFYKGQEIARQDQNINYPWYVDASRPFVHTVTIDGVEQKRWCSIGLIEYHPNTGRLIFTVNVKEKYLSDNVY